MENPKPLVYQQPLFVGPQDSNRYEQLLVSFGTHLSEATWTDENLHDIPTTLDVYRIIRKLKDPEHPLTLEELHVVSLDDIQVYGKDMKRDGTRKFTVDVQFTPTVPHCSQATLIGLMIRTKLYLSLPRGTHIIVRVTQGTSDRRTTFKAPTRVM